MPNQDVRAIPIRREIIVSETTQLSAFCGVPPEEVGLNTMRMLRRELSPGLFLVSKRTHDLRTLFVVKGGSSRGSQ